MQASDERRMSVRAPLLAVVVAGLHVAAVGSFLVIQGCGTTRPAAVEAPPPPVMPPRQDALTPGPVDMPKPAFQPPAIEKAPASLEAAATQTYTVQSGDSLSKIAAKVGVTSREIAELNNIKDANKIRLGQKLVLPSYAQPVPGGTAKPEAKPVAKKAPVKVESSAPAVAGSGEYVVRSGDSLSKIAVRNGTTVKALREVNQLKSDSIRIGQKLKLPAGAVAKVAAPAVVPAVESTPAPVPPAATPAPVVPAPEPAVDAVPAVTAEGVPPLPAGLDASSTPESSFKYTIQPGDLPEDVAKKFGLTSQQVLDFNGLTAASFTSGKEIKIPVASP